MASDYLIVHRNILPDYLEKVIEARQLLVSHQAKTVTEAAQLCGISRNTYYKYKDYVFLPGEQAYRRKAVISLVVHDEAGCLSAVLTAISSLNASIITISQAIPLGGKASVTISLDIQDMQCSTEEMIAKLQALPQTITVLLDAME